MNWLARLCMQGWKVVGSVSIASFLASAFAFVLLCPRGICMRRFGLQFLLCHLRAFRDGMLDAVTFAAFMNVIVASRAHITAFACTGASVVSSARSQILHFDPFRFRMLNLRPLVPTDVAILWCAPAYRR